ncbi:polyprenyl synthetase family protein [Psychrobacter pygoscelis]|uniref:polyprenyl synthetase family protein n=1 Tax=Psychrobacter pygoscelis TaxID=2488563 RepID=UPI00103EE317|nr:farnesyl diphosphate synthase [Psychrobacter pygoscelis]
MSKFNNDAVVPSAPPTPVLAATQDQLSFDALRSHTTQLLTADIEQLIEVSSLPEPLRGACHYAMSGSGKRVRPLLVASAFMTLQGKFGPSESSAPILNDACRRAMLAVELLHAYSLIHDDLPCMDDDDLRRGQPTCHIAFDEATALLAGDVLQTLAFEVLSADIDGFAAIDTTLSLRLIKVFAPRARRMVAGQMLDLNAESTPICQEALEAIHRDKTGALIEAASLMGAICADASDTELDTVQHFSANLGLAFQVQDDILDVTVSTDDLGKPAGSDEKLDKSTYVKLMGVETASEYARELFDSAKAAVVQTFGDDNQLIELANWLWKRNK